MPSNPSFDQCLITVKADWHLLPLLLRYLRTTKEKIRNKKPSYRISLRVRLGFQYLCLQCYWNEPHLSRSRAFSFLLSLTHSLIRFLCAFAMHCTRKKKCIVCTFSDCLNKILTTNNPTYSGEIECLKTFLCTQS